MKEQLRKFSFQEDEPKIHISTNQKLIVISLLRDEVKKEIYAYGISRILTRTDMGKIINQIKETLSGKLADGSVSKLINYLNTLIL